MSGKGTAAKKAAPAEKKAEAYKPTLEKGAPAHVPESVFKKQQRDQKLAAAAAAKAIKTRKANRKLRSEIYKRAAKYAAEYKTAEKNLVRMKRQAKNNGNFYVEPEPKVLLAVRIRGIMRTSPKTRKILQLLRLKQLNNAVFIRANKATLSLLRFVEPYVAYGAPTLKTVKELIYKRGYLKINRQRTRISENAIVARNLGRFGIQCVEDLIHEIVTCGPHFKEANNTLWPFKLNNPLGGWKDKGTHFTEGGDAGNREEYINQLVRRMN